MPGLRETLDDATPEWIAGSRYPECLSLWNGQHGKHVRMPSAADAQLAALAPELAAEVLELRERHREAMALVLDMGEALRAAHDPERWSDFLAIQVEELLARLDQLGKEQTDG